MTKKVLLAELRRRIAARIESFHACMLEEEPLTLLYEHYEGCVTGLQEVLAMLEDYD